ncbi:ArsR/SmtB family transcription factor [Mucisphaera sp.]|uniref:ArsR/SmtB family transcription factor n=1 Tax=Mucisphaera sp. TaxID=2913024 RepID=UPI003D0D15B1
MSVDHLLKDFATLAEPTRLRLLRSVETGELAVSDLCAVLQMPQSTVSRHLKVLTDEGWVLSRKEGTTNYYRLDADRIQNGAADLWTLACTRTEAWPTLKQDRLRLAERLRQRRGATRRFFEDTAAAWDELRVDLYGQFFGHRALVGLLPDDWVVGDLGCGTGRVVAELAPQVKRVIGVDDSEQMLDAARQSTEGLGNVDLLRAPIEAIPLEDQSLDAALLVLALSYVELVEPVLAEARRLLKSGGRVVIVDLLQHDDEEFRRRYGQQCAGFEPMRLEAQLSEAGFAGVRTRALPPEAEAGGPAMLLMTAGRGGGA